MKYRKLRIAWSVVWGLAAVLLIALWVRSYATWDWIPFTTSKGRLALESNQGRAGLVYEIYSLQKISNDFITSTYQGGWELLLPHWAIGSMAVAVAAAPWSRQLRLRFSLRTLLIVTTLAAGVLGLFVYALRQ